MASSELLVDAPPGQPPVTQTNIRVFALVMRFQFFANADMFWSVANTPPDSRLWWTHDWLPSLPSPFFPFMRTVVAGEAVYRRALDGYSFSTQAPPI